MRVLSVDPGPQQSAYLVYDGKRPAYMDITGNGELLERLQRTYSENIELVIEGVACFGMPVGVEVFDTVFWSGRFVEAWGGKWSRVYRQDVKLHLCGSARAKDANIRQALLDKFGGSKAIGKKAAPGPLYGVKSHLWSALALAVTYCERPQLAAVS